uniref:Uncharacterized protein n=1 Tax=Opuntia streptacantha TaxID=393608 RepID=A0A7C9ECD3_OPUST
MRNELFVIPTPDGCDFTHKLHELHTMTSVGEEEINAMIQLLNSDCLACSIMLKNKLLQIKESPSVRDMLPKLNCCHPLIWICLKPRTIVTHLMVHNILNDVSLL